MSGGMITVMINFDCDCTEESLRGQIFPKYKQEVPNILLKLTWLRCVFQQSLKVISENISPLIVWIHLKQDTALRFKDPTDRFRITFMAIHFA